jgi:hypothetical protein
MANGGDIIIKGSSVDIDYDDAVYPPVLGKPRNHKSNDQTIIQVLVVDGGGTKKYDSNDDGADPSAWKVTVYCK